MANRNLVHELILLRNGLDRLIQEFTPAPTTYIKNIAELDQSDIYQKLLPEWSQQDLTSANSNQLVSMIHLFLTVPSEFNPRESPKTIDEIHDFLCELSLTDDLIYNYLSRGQQKFLSAIRKNYALWAKRYNNRLRWLRTGELAKNDHTI